MKNWDGSNKSDKGQKNSGRDIAKRYGLLIRATCIIVAALPIGVRNFLWHLANFGDYSINILIRYAILSSYCEKIGKNVYVGPNVLIINARRLSIGDNVSIHFGCYVDAAGGCVIGDNVSIAHMSSLVTFEHTWEDADRPIKYNPTRYSPIRIGTDVWIGCGVRVLSGSTIGDRVVVAANAVIRGECTTGTLYAGVPARAIKLLSE